MGCGWATFVRNMSRQQLRTWPNYHTTWSKFTTKEDRTNGDEHLVISSNATARQLTSFNLTRLGRQGHGAHAYVTASDNR